MNILMRSVNRQLFHYFKEPQCIRTLFTPESLGLTKYESNREKVISYTHHYEDFKLNFKQQIEHAATLKLLVDSLKTFLHLINNNNEDIELLWKALRLYSIQREQWDKKSDVEMQSDYLFGPIVMRAFSYLQIPNTAIDFFEDEKIGTIFNELISYQILLDLLYDSKMCSDVLRIYPEIEKRLQADNMCVSSPIYAIIFATYYRLNTPEYFKQAFELYDKLKESNRHKKQYRKAVALVGAMKLKTQKPDECLEILSIFDDDNNKEVRYIRILAYAQLNNFEQVFRLLRLTIKPKDQLHYGSKSIPKIPDQLLQEVETKLKRFGDEDKLKEYQTIFDEIKQLDRILYKNLDDVLCSRFSSKLITYSPFDINKKFEINKKKLITINIRNLNTKFV